MRLLGSCLAEYHSGKKHLLALSVSVCFSTCIRVALTGRNSLNWILETVMQIYWENANLVKALYMQAWVHYVLLLPATLIHCKSTVVERSVFLCSWEVTCSSALYRQDIVALQLQLWLTQSCHNVLLYVHYQCLVLNTCDFYFMCKLWNCWSKTSCLASKRMCWGASSCGNFLYSCCTSHVTMHCLC